MKFQPAGHRSEISDCERYTVACVTTFDIDSWEAWYRPTPKQSRGAMSLGHHLPDKQAAYQACIDHHSANVPRVTPDTPHPPQKVTPC